MTTHPATVSLRQHTRAARPWHRVDGIDLLRGLSITFVLLNHVNMRLVGAHVPYDKNLPPQVDLSLAWNGQFGVQMFFVISGFLITSTSLRRWGSPARLRIREFYLLRVARIAPLLLTLLAVLSLLHVARVPGFVISPRTGGLPRALLAALTFHINLLEATRDYLPAAWDILWSLSVEEMFYVAFPLVARVLRSPTRLYPLLLLFILAGPFARARAFNHNPVWREYSFLGGMDAIALGCLTAMLLKSARPTGQPSPIDPSTPVSQRHTSPDTLPHRRLPRPAILLGTTLGAALLLFSLCFSLQAYRWGLGRNGLNMTLLALGTALLVAVATESAWQAPRLLRPLLLLGQRSYEIYLTHIFAVLALFSVFLHVNITHRLGPLPIRNPLHLVPALFLLSIAAAALLGAVVAIRFAEPANLHLRRRFGLASTLPAATPPVD